MPLTDKLHQKEDVIAQRNGAEVLLFDMASGEYFSLNELGCRIWELCDGTRALQEVADLLVTEYDAPQGVIVDDLEILAAELLESGLLRR